MKKVIALIAAAAVIISILNIAVYATSEPTAMTSKEYYSAQSYLIDKWVNGDITYSQYQDQSQAVTNEFVNTNTVGGVVNSGVLTVSNTFNAVSQKIGKAVDDWGDEARDRVKDWWNDVCNKNNVPTETTQTSAIDMYGYGACLFYKQNGSLIRRYCNYIVIRNDGKYYYANPVREYYPSSNTWSSTVNGIIAKPPSEILGIYGDIRYEDGTQAPTDDIFEYDTIKNFGDMSERDLEDLLNDFSEEMDRQNPDFSSIEGLLNAIYARLGTLDSDNDNALLSKINTSIQSLNASISGIETSINDLKETITSLFSNGDKKDDDNTEDDNKTEKHEIAGTLYNVIPLEKSWLKKFSDEVFDNKANLKVEYEGKVYYLEDDGTLKLGDKYYKVDMNYSSDLDAILDTLFDIRDSLELLTEEEKKMNFSDFFDLKVNDFKLDLDEKFAFKDNLKDFIQNFFDVFNSSVPVYESGD